MRTLATTGRSRARAAAAAVVLALTLSPRVARAAADQAEHLSRQSRSA